MANEDRVVLIVEDDEGLRTQLKWALDSYEVHTASTREEALAAARRFRPAVIVLDLGLPPDPDGATEGHKTLKELLLLDAASKVVIASGNDDRENAVRAIGLGAYDFYAKPIDPDVLNLIIARAFDLYDLERENETLSRGLMRDSAFEGLIAASPKMLRICEAVEKVAGSAVNVLFFGESGTGKEIFARALHQTSERKDGPFVAINCAAIPDNLLESELFGHERGSFTGAVKQSIGKVERAQGGTLFLDEIGDMPLALQAKMLRFLQERVIERIGGTKQISIDVRVVSATNKDLKRAIEEGTFREDLFYRLNEVSFEVPPLRDREGDAVLIAQHKLRQFAAMFEKSVKGLAPDAVEAISQYEWPGNVRELENRLKRAVVLSGDGFISAEDLDLEAPADGESIFPTLRQVRECAERDLIERALVAVDNNVSQAASILGVSRPTLYSLMKSYGVKR